MKKDETWGLRSNELFGDTADAFGFTVGVEVDERNSVGKQFAALFYTPLNPDLADGF